MQPQTFFRHHLFSVVLGLFVLAVASLPARAALPCGCGSIGVFESKADHLAAYDAMTNNMKKARANLTSLEKAAEAAKGAFTNDTKCLAELEKASAALNEALDSAARVRSTAALTLFESNRQADLKLFRTSVSNTWQSLEVSGKNLSTVMEKVGEGGQKLHAAEAEVRSAKSSLDTIYGSIRTVWGGHSKAKCVDRIYHQYVNDIQTSAKAAEGRFEEERRGAERVEEALKSKMEDVGRRRKEAGDWIGSLADRLNLSGISTFDALDAKLAELSRTKIRIRFFNGESLMEERTIFDNEPVAEPSANPEAPRDGMVFNGWRDAAASETERFVFGASSAKDLNLRAVWCYEVGVENVEKVWPILADGTHTLREVLESEEVKAAEREVESTIPDNREFAGWKTSEGDAVNGLTRVMKPLRLVPRYRDIVFSVRWHGADRRPIETESFTKGDTPNLRDLPPNTQQYAYQYWSETPDGEEYVPRPLDGNLDLYAVRQKVANLVALSFVDHDDAQIGETLHVKEGTDFLRVVGVPRRIVRSGFRFVGWGKNKDSREVFSGPVEEPERGEGLQLQALYRDASLSEKIDDALAGLRDDCPFEAVVAVDVLLLVLFVFLLATGPRRRRGRRAAVPVAPDGSDADSGDDSSGEPPSGSGVAAEGALVVLLLFLPAVAFAAEGEPPDPFEVPSFDPACLLYPGALLVGIVLLATDACMIACRIGRGILRLFSGVASIFSRKPRMGDGLDKPDVPGEKSGPEECPTCGKQLVNGECPDEHTIPRCPHCNSIIRDGACPKCGIVDNEVELCPTCGSELRNGECPREHTIVRCSKCGSILQEGDCPKGCNAPPLHLGWPGGAAQTLSEFALKVVECPDDDGNDWKGFCLRVPDRFVVGRTSRDCKEPFVSLKLSTVKSMVRAQCSRQYVRFDRGGANDAFTVTLVTSNRQTPASVDGRELATKNASVPVSVGGRIKLYPGFELELVKDPQ